MGSAGKWPDPEHAEGEVGPKREASRGGGGAVVFHAVGIALPRGQRFSNV